MRGREMWGRDGVGWTVITSMADGEVRCQSKLGGGMYKKVTHVVDVDQYLGSDECGPLSSRTGMSVAKGEFEREKVRTPLP